MKLKSDNFCSSVQAGPQKERIVFRHFSRAMLNLRGVFFVEKYTGVSKLLFWEKRSMQAKYEGYFLEISPPKKEMIPSLNVFFEDGLRLFNKNIIWDAPPPRVPVTTEVRDLYNLALPLRSWDGFQSHLKISIRSSHPEGELFLTSTFLLEKNARNFQSGFWAWEIMCSFHFCIRFIGFFSAKAVPRSEVAMSKINLQVSLVNLKTLRSD